MDAKNCNEVLASLVDDELKPTVGIMGQLITWLPVTESDAVRQLSQEARYPLLLRTMFSLLSRIACEEGLFIIFDDAQWSALPYLSWCFCTSYYFIFLIRDLLLYTFVHSTHTYSHTHTYIYIYIYICKHNPQCSVSMWCYLSLSSICVSINIIFTY